MKQLTINLMPSYPIVFSSEQLKETMLADFCKKQAATWVIITDSNLVDTYAKAMLDYLAQHQLQAEILCFPAGEQYKTRETKAILEDQLLAKQYGRDTCLIAVGGGVVSDVTGFIAATYCRGIPAIYVPTTLLAMVDASIGGKTGVDTPYGKNLIGAFYQPHAVFIGLDALKNLPKAEFKNGLVEIIKHAIIADPELFTLLEQKRLAILNQDEMLLQQIIFKSCEIKKNIVEQDEKDFGIRHLLNFGHTIGHAVEMLEHYEVSHGEAVAIGMLVESYLALLMGFLPEAVFDQIVMVIKSYELPLKTKAFLDIDIFKKTLVLDKKSEAQMPHFVLLDDLAKPRHEGKKYSFAVPEDKLNQALAWAVRNFSF